MTEQQVEDLAYEELVSDALSRMLIDGTVVEMTANLRKADKGLWNVFKKAVSALLEKWSAIFEAYKNKTPDAKEAQWLDGAESSFKKLQKMFAEAFADASAAYEQAGEAEDGSSERNRKAQARELQRKDPTQLKEADLVNLLEYAKGKLLDDDTYIPVRIGTPQILIAFARELGYQLDNHPLAMRVYKARQALSNEADWDGDYKDKPHNLSPENIVEIIFALNDPSYLVFQTENERFAEIIKFQREGSKEKAYAIVDFSDVDKNPAVMNGYKGGKYNILVTVYPSEDAAELKTYLSKKNHKVVTGEAMKKKGASQGSYGGNTPSLLNDTPFFNDSIPNPAEKVKVKNSDRDYSYNALTSKPDMVVTTLGGTVPGNRADVVAAAKKNAAKVGKTNKDGSVSVHVNDIGRDVVLGTNGLKHGLDRRFAENAPTTLKAGSVLQNSIRINELTPQKTEADASYVLIGAATDGADKLYVVRSVVNKFSNELVSMDVLYAINTKKGNWPRSVRPGFQGPVTSSTISIAELLDYVNRYFPDILPEDVLSHFGHTERPAGKLGKNVLYQQRSTDRDDTKAERKGRFNRYAVETALWDALDHGDKGHDNLILVSEMPQYIVDKFGIEGDFYIYRDHAYENMVSKDQAIDEGRPVTHHGQKAHFHGLGIDKMTKAILSINDPTMVIATKSKDGNPSVIMLLDEFGSNGAPLYAVLSFYSNKAVNGDWSRKPHIVLTIAERNYTETGGRAGYDEIIRNAIKDGRVLDYNIRKRDDLSVIANSAGVGNITKSSLEDSLTRFRKEIKTFREKNKFNYQQRNTDSDHDEVVKQLEQENKKLADDLAEVKELLSLQGKVTGGKVFTKTSVQLVAKRLMREVSAEGNTAELAALLEEVYHYIADGGEVTWDGVTDKAAPALAWLESHEGKRQEYADYIFIKFLPFSRFYLDTCGV